MSCPQFTAPTWLVQGLITVGGFDDAYSPHLPATMALDHERYNLTAYITDGDTNVSLRKGMSVEELTYDEALALLADKAAQGPPKKKASRKAAPKKAAPKKAATKRATAKKSAKKSTKSVKGESDAPF